MSRTWIKVHIEFLDNPKIMTLSLSLRGVWFTALAIAERYDNDGLLPPASRFALMAHMDDETTEKAYAALVAKGLLDKTADGYRIHDWQEWQARKPSDEPEAVAARQAKWYAAHKGKDLTPPNALDGVERKPNAPNAYARAPSESESKRENTPPEVLRTSAPRTRGGRIPAAWPNDADLIGMNAYGESLGIRAGDVASHISEFRDYWGQATKNATSLDWVKRWRVRLAQDVREGKVGGSRASPAGRPPVTFEQQREINNERHAAEFLAIIEGKATDGPTDLHGADGSTRRRLPG